MIVYSVKIKIKKIVEEEWLDWMKKCHIKDVMKTNYFNDWKIFKILVPESPAEESEYVIEYIADSYENYEAYANKESKRLQEEHNIRFAGHFSAERVVKAEIN